MTNKLPGDGGRRSRRGYSYQDLHSLDRWLDLADGRLTSVILEGVEDVTCIDDCTQMERFEQVKTREDPNQLWSVALITAPKSGSSGGAKTVARSILGRLFSDKVVSERSSFLLVLNEGVNDQLRPLTSSVAAAEELAVTRQAICERLSDLHPDGDLSLSECVDRLAIEVRSRTLEDMESALIRRLPAFVESVCSIKPLSEEVETLLDLLVAKVAAEARAEEPSEFGRESVLGLIRDSFDRVSNPQPAQGDADASRLRSKLQPVGFEDLEIEKCIELHLRHRREYRQATARRRAATDRMVDDVFMACTRVSVSRRAGNVTPGEATYEATLNAMQDLYQQNYTQTDFSLADLHRAMFDIAARCQHRFVA